jgi:hypothetical protein
MKVDTCCVQEVDGKVVELEGWKVKMQNASSCDKDGRRV